MQKRKNGWQVRWRENGKQRARTFKLKSEAREFEYKLERGKADTRRQSSMTFEDLATDFLERYVRIEKAGRSWIEDGLILKNHLLPAFGKKKIASLTKSDLITFRADLVTEKNLSPKTVNNITGLGKRILQVATEWELLFANPWQAVKPLKIQKQPFDFWMPDEAETFLAACKDLAPNVHAVALFALRTGMRRGEIQGLKRDCLDFENRLITVRRSWDWRGKKLSEETKSKRVRMIPMTDDVVDLLDTRRGHVFAFPEARTIGAKQIRKLAKVARVKPIRFHDLRHTFASHLAMQGTPLAVIQMLLGHSTIAMTERYAHLHPETLRAAVNALSAHNVRAQGRIKLSIVNQSE